MSGIVIVRAGTDSLVQKCIVVAVALGIKEAPAVCIVVAAVLGTKEVAAVAMEEDMEAVTSERQIRTEPAQPHLENLSHT